MKDFDNWNNQKKIINGLSDKFYHERDIWWCVLGINIGSEQDGTGIGYQRPVLIIKSFGQHTCLIAPLTTSNKQHPYRFPIGTVARKKSAVILSQLRLIDTKRLVNKIVRLDKYLFEQIRKAVRDLL